MSIYENKTPTSKLLNYHLDILESGLPEISSDEIFHVPVNSTITFKIQNGTAISNHPSLITNTTIEFPTIDYLDSIIQSPDLDSTSLSKYSLPPTKQNTIIYFTLSLSKPGPKIIAFLYLSDEDGKYHLTPPFTILVQPEIYLGEDKTISLNQIQMQTVLSKNIGYLSSDFEKFYEETHLLNYNLLHFTTINALSATNSLYVLKSHNEISNSFFEKELQHNTKQQLFQKQFSLFKSHFNIASVVDLILHQVSIECKEITSHPECAYTLANTPWLTVAYELDKILCEYSANFYNKKVACKSAPYINNESDLEEAISEIRKDILKNNLEEFFLIPIEKYYDEFKTFYSANKEEDKEYAMKRVYLLNELKENFNVEINQNSLLNLSEDDIYDLISQSCSNYGEARFGVKISVEFVSLLIIESSKKNESILNEFNFLRIVKQYINKVNEEWSNKAKEMLEIAIANVKEFIRYEFIQLKRTGIKRKLIDNYFNVVGNDPNDKSKIFLCNGWVMQNEDPNEVYPDITKCGTWYYFKRKVIVWPDTIKLNYGHDITETNKYLIEYMTQYVTENAQIFDGFVIDNALSVPLFALQYFARKAREVNENCVLIAHFPEEDNSSLEAHYANKVGINLFIKEMIWCTSTEDITERISKYSNAFRELSMHSDDVLTEIQKNPANKFEVVQYRYLKPCKPLSIIYDLTQDNQTYYEQLGDISLNLSMMASLGLIDSAIASTRGYDQLYPYQPSSINENRKYRRDESFANLIDELHRVALQKESAKEIFFEFHPRDCDYPYTRSVRLALSSNDWRPDINLTRINNNLFTARVRLHKGKYYYKYVLDNNIWIHDKTQPMEIDKDNNINNVIDICDDTKLLANDLKLIRRDLNLIRDEFKGKESEVYVKRDNDLMCVIRMLKDQKDFCGYCVICRFGIESNSQSTSEITIPCEICDFICGCYMNAQNFEINSILCEKDLCGIKSEVYYTKDMNFLSSIANLSYSGGKTSLRFHSILANTAVVLKLRNSANICSAIENLNLFIERINEDNDNDYIGYFDSGDINAALFRSEFEEKDCTFNKRGLYIFDEKNKYFFKYAGIAQYAKLCVEEKKKNLNSRMYNLMKMNISQGDWLFEYILFRFDEIASFRELTGFLRDNIFANYIRLSPHLKMKFFDKILFAVYNLILKRCLSSIPNELINFGDFSLQLLTSQFQFLGNPISSTFAYSLGKSQINLDQNILKLSISKGLPNFATGRYRFCIRESLLAFNSLFLIPKRFAEAKTMLLMFASLLRHGQIPNIIDCGSKPRYNSRDTSFLFIASIKNYIASTNDYNILREVVELVYCDDDTETHYRKKSRGEKLILTLSDAIHHILQRHAEGISYTEYKAGPSLQAEMHYEGFKQRIELDPLSGFVYGGNEYNCGTWMDKIGCSVRGHNRGVPATPRNGAPIEIEALVYVSICFVIDLASKGFYKYKSVTLRNGVSYPFSQWRLLIKDNFEREFFVAKVNRYGRENVYKDYLAWPKEKSDMDSMRKQCQLRPNAIYAILSAPDLFTKSNVIKYIDNVEKYLLHNKSSVKNNNRIGIKTLDCGDTEYKGYYNCDDNGDYLTSCGFNLHNGIEYVWLYAYYLRLKIEYTEWKSKEDMRRWICNKLIPIIKCMNNNQWMGLPEMTNEKGDIVNEGCQTHLLAVSSVIELVAALSNDKFT